MVSTTLTPLQLEASTDVDTYDPERGNDPDNGYQRRPSSTRIAQAAAFYGEGEERRQGCLFEDRKGLTPNPIITNIRPNGTEDGDGFPGGVHISFYSDADRTRVMQDYRERHDPSRCRGDPVDRRWPASLWCDQAPQDPPSARRRLPGTNQDHAGIPA